MYYFGKHQLTNEYILNMISESFDLIKGNFRHKNSFGFLWGVLRTNLPKNFIYFGKEEFEKFQADDFFYY